MNTKAPTYEWRCRNCDAVNVAHTSVCAACGFDTINCYAPSPLEQMRRAGVPAWRGIAAMLIVGVGAVVGFIGFFLMTRVYFLTDLAGMAWSTLATLIGVGLLFLAQKLHPVNISRVDSSPGCSPPGSRNPIAKRSLFEVNAPSPRAEERSNGRS